MSFDPFNYPDAQYRTFVGQYSTKISAAPLPLSLTVAQATELSSRTSAFEAAFLDAEDPATRTRAKISLKRSTRKNLTEYGRMLARIIQAAPTVTDEQRIDLGLPVRDTLPTPIQPPDLAPVAEVAEMNGWKAKFKVRPAGSEGRSSRPEGVALIQAYSFVGPTPPGNVNEWKSEGLSSRAIFEIAFDSEVPVGSRVWACCQWVTARGLTSPASAPIGLLIGGGVPDVGAA